MFCSRFNRERIIPRDIQLAIACDGELDTLNDRLSSIIIPKELVHTLTANYKKFSSVIDVDNAVANVEDDKEDKDYSQPDDTDDTDDDDYEEEDSNTDEEDKTGYRWVGDKDRFHAFLYWLSGNECSDEDKEEITGSFNLLCGCFTAKDLLTGVRRSGLFSIEEITNTVLDIISHARKDIRTSEEFDEDENNYFGMLSNVKND